MCRMGVKSLSASLIVGGSVLGVGSGGREWGQGTGKRGATNS